MRKHHDLRLGLHSAATRLGKKWAESARRTLWFELLKPLHPPLLDATHLDRFAKVRSTIVDTDADLQAHERAAKRARRDSAIRKGKTSRTVVS